MFITSLPTDAFPKRRLKVTRYSTQEKFAHQSNTDVKMVEYRNQLRNRVQIAAGMDDTNEDRNENADVENQQNTEINEFLAAAVVVNEEDYDAA